jgi:hypothetical protein
MNLLPVRGSRRQEEVAAVRKRHALRVLPLRENPPSRGHPQGSHHPQGLAAVPLHLLPVKPFWVAWGRDTGAGWVGKRRWAGRREAEKPGLRPVRSAQAQWPLAQEGAVPRRRERRSPGFATAVGPRAASTAACVSARASSRGQLLVPRAFQLRGSISAGRTDLEVESKREKRRNTEETAAQLSGHRLPSGRRLRIPRRRLCHQHQRRHRCRRPHRRHCRRRLHHQRAWAGQGAERAV